MIERIHEHILDELKVNTKTDTVFILTAILLNFITLGIHSIFAQGTAENLVTNENYMQASDYVIFWFIVVLVVVVNIIVIIGLKRGKETRFKLLSGLIKMYEDQNVNQYYDSSIFGTYNTRYLLFTITVVATGVLSFFMPFILMIMG